MGNNYSFQSLNPENYEEVRLSNEGMFGEITAVRFPFGSKPTSLRDDKLWQEFGKEIDELLPLLNKHLCLLLFVTPLLIMIALFVATVGLGLANDPMAIVYIGITFFVVIIFTIVTLIKIHSRNEKVDEQINKFCANCTRRFQEHGIVPQYRTKWTGFLKPRGARPLRMIVFVPAGNLSA